MLTITNVKKTFNKGTVNEKKALNGIKEKIVPLIITPLWIICTHSGKSARF